MPVTAKEIAERLGLSETAVSFALNDKKGISRKTKRRIIDAAHEMGYDFARKEILEKERRRTICFIVYKKSGAVVDDTPFFSQLSQGISGECMREDYSCFIRYFYEDENILRQIYNLDTSRFAGIILLATEMNEASLKNFAGIDIPMLILDAYFDTLPSYNYVAINNVQGAFAATNYLFKKRRKQPGYLRSMYPISNFDYRADGFYKAIRENGMSASKSIVHHLTPSQEGAYGDMKNLLKSGEEPADCYFADNDLIAMGAFQAFTEAGYRVPEDIAIVGFDDLPACEYMTPPLSTVEVPKYFMGVTAAKRIIQMTEDKNTLPLKIEISTNLIKRKSV